MRLFGWVCIWLGLFGIAFFGYNLYTPDLVRMQESTVYLEVVQDCSDKARHTPGEGQCIDVLGHGAGVILDNGYVLTAGHVADVLRFEDIKIIVRFRGGESTTATLVESEWDIDNSSIVSDIALLKVEKTYDYPPAYLNCNFIPVGTPLFVVGHPSVTLWTVTQGYVMGTTPRYGYERGHWLAIDATIWKGNSGGPVFDRFGRIVGIVSHGIVTRFGGPVGLNYAVSGPIICDFMEDNYDGSYWGACSPRYPWLRGEPAYRWQADALA